MATDEEYWKRQREDCKRRLQDAINSEGVDFVIKMVSSFHTTDGGAYYRMQDYLSAKGY